MSLVRSIRRTVVAVGLFASGFAASPGCATDGTSGETHFVACDDAADCAGEGPNTACLERQCRPPGSGGLAECDPASVRDATGYPEDPERGCVDTSNPVRLGRACGGGVPGYPTCGKRDTDGALFLLDPDLPEGFSACTETELTRMTFSCDFADCETPPASTCSRGDACAVGKCASKWYDQQGCLRTPCSNDGECPAEERCTVLECADVSRCSYVNGECACGGPAVCAATTTCRPVSDVGPRGAWRSLQVRVGCPDGGSPCERFLEVTSEGVLGFILPERSGSQRLRADQLQRVEKFVNGEELRRLLRDGLDCAGGAQAEAVQMRLVLPESTLQQTVEACAGRIDGGVIYDLVDLLEAWARETEPCAGVRAEGETLDGSVAVPDCTYFLPPLSDGGAFDPVLISVALTGGAADRRLGYLDEASLCGARLAWYYDDPVAPTELTLCPAACSALQDGAPDVGLTIGLGCGRTPSP